MPLLTIDEVMTRLSVSRATVYRLIKKPEFPKPIHVTECAPRFDAGEIDRWLESRRESRAA